MAVTVHDMLCFNEECDHEWFRFVHSNVRRMNALDSFRKKAKKKWAPARNRTLTHTFFAAAAAAGVAVRQCGISRFCCCCVFRSSACSQAVAISGTVYYLEKVHCVQQTFPISHMSDVRQPNPLVVNGYSFFVRFLFVVVAAAAFPRKTALHTFVRSAGIKIMVSWIYRWNRRKNWADAASNERSEERPFLSFYWVNNKLGKRICSTTSIASLSSPGWYGVNLHDFHSISRLSRGARLALSLCVGGVLSMISAHAIVREKESHFWAISIVTILNDICASDIALAHRIASFSLRSFFVRFPSLESFPIQFPISIDFSERSVSVAPSPRCLPLFISSFRFHFLRYIDCTNDLMYSSPRKKNLRQLYQSPYRYCSLSAYIAREHPIASPSLHLFFFPNPFTLFFLLSLSFALFCVSFVRCRFLICAVRGTHAILSSIGASLFLKKGQDERGTNWCLLHSYTKITPDNPFISDSSRTRPSRNSNNMQLSILFGIPNQYIIRHVSPEGSACVPNFWADADE